MTGYSPAQRRLVLVAAVLASSMGFIDGSVVSIITPAIRSSLGASLGDAQWISGGYLLTLSSLLLLGGATGDRFGLRNVFAAGIALFVATSIVSAAAPTPLFLILARTTQGIGAAFMVPASLAIIAKAYPKEQRGAAIGIWAAASSLTTLLAPVAGGLLLAAIGNEGWRLVFAINLPLGGVALALLFQTPAELPDRERPMDIAGAVAATLALLLISLAFIDPGERFWLYLGGGLLVLVGFLVWEARVAAPMLPLGLFRDRAFAGAQALTFTLYFGLSAVTFYLPMLMIAGWGVSAAEVAIAMLPLGVALTVLSSLAGRITDRLGPGPVVGSGSLVVAVAFLGLGLSTPLHDVWRAVLPLMVLFGIGMSGVAGPISTAVMTSVEDRDTGTASAINNAVARIAGLLAVASMGALAALVYGNAAGPDGPGFGLAPAAPLPAPLELARIAATDHAFSVVAYVAAGLALGAAVLGWTTLRRAGPVRGD